MQRKYYIGLVLAISIIVILSVGYITSNIFGGSGFSSGSVTKVDMQGNTYSGNGELVLIFQLIGRYIR